MFDLGGGMVMMRRLVGVLSKGWGLGVNGVGGGGIWGLVVMGDGRMG